MSYCSNNRFAASCAFWMNCVSVSMSNGMSLIHDCCVQSISHGQRYSKSISANSNPSFVFSIALSLL